MASSGIPWIDLIFNVSVRWLYVCADWLGITYEEINVWLFCIVWPLITLVMTVWIVLLRRNIRRIQSLSGS